MAEEDTSFASREFIAELGRHVQIGPSFQSSNFPILLSPYCITPLFAIVYTSVSHLPLPLVLNLLTPGPPYSLLSENLASYFSRGLKLSEENFHRLSTTHTCQSGPSPSFCLLTSSCEERSVPLSNPALLFHKRSIRERSTTTSTWKGCGAQIRG